ncbi:hypothetical protein DUI87_00436 [Hirundo rustica rustica]|uniref:Uncharacterized protein n=1 Tax=Hirundo rustica rustica TaxID=333673 RepID=A0A3M0LAM2_HIRRU|nr:hypothetical protein DUI87_00436 [Hirundo rustica rustica]
MQVQVQAFLAALQTQWSWMLQLCCCIETHLKENTNYFQFFAEVREAEELLRKTEETMRRKFSCDRGTTATRLEDLLQDPGAINCPGEEEEEEEEEQEKEEQEEEEQEEEEEEEQEEEQEEEEQEEEEQQEQEQECENNRFVHVAVRENARAKMGTVTVHKNDACALLSHAQPQQWRVLSAAGSEAVVPSVCFLLPPPNTEALDAVRRLEASHQQLQALWQELHQDLRSLRSWQYLTRHIQQIQSWTPVTFRALPAEEARQALCGLESRYQEFLRDSQGARSFQPDERCSWSATARPARAREQDESLCRSYISQLKDIRLRLESCESRTVHRLRLPLQADALRDCAQRQAEQQVRGAGGARAGDSCGTPSDMRVTPE